jgi:hypothetical protein
MKIESIFALSFWGFSSAGSEHLPYKQRVGGSNPSTPTTQKPVPRMRDWFLFFRTFQACLNKDIKNKNQTSAKLRTVFVF